MRVTDRLTRHRRFSTDVTTKRHRGVILPDSVHESKANPAAPSPLQFFKGVGPARAEILARMGIRTLLDLLTYYPRDWEDRRLRFSTREAPIGQKVTLKGRIRSVDFSTTRSRLGIATVAFEDSSGPIEAVWFKNLTPRYDVFSALRRQLMPGRFLYAYGLIEWGP